MCRSFRTDFTKDSAVYYQSVNFDFFFLLFFQRTRQQLSQGRVCQLTAYLYAKFRDGLTEYLLLLSEDKF